MSVSKLNDSAEFILGKMGLESQTEAAVRRCFAKYKRPSSKEASQLIGWIAYRGFNMLKSICGQSDWNRIVELVKFDASNKVDVSGEVWSCLYKMERVETYNDKWTPLLLAECFESFEADHPISDEMREREKSYDIIQRLVAFGGNGCARK